MSLTHLPAPIAAARLLPPLLTRTDCRTPDRQRNGTYFHAGSTGFQIQLSDHTQARDVIVCAYAGWLLKHWKTCYQQSDPCVRSRLLTCLVKIDHELIRSLRRLVDGRNSVEVLLAALSKLRGLLRIHSLNEPGRSADRCKDFVNKPVTRRAGRR